MTAAVLELTPGRCEVCDRPGRLEVFAGDVLAHLECVPAHWRPDHDPRPARKWRVGFNRRRDE